MASRFHGAPDALVRGVAQKISTAPQHWADPSTWLRASCVRPVHELRSWFVLRSWFASMPFAAQQWRADAIGRRPAPRSSVQSHGPVAASYIDLTSIINSIVFISLASVFSTGPDPCNRSINKDVVVALLRLQCCLFGDFVTNLPELIAALYIAPVSTEDCRWSSRLWLFVAAPNAIPIGYVRRRQR
jgi:hypothetical protein